MKFIELIKRLRKKVVFEALIVLPLGDLKQNIFLDGGAFLWPSSFNSLPISPIYCIIKAILKI